MLFWQRKRIDMWLICISVFEVRVNALETITKLSIVHYSPLFLGLLGHSSSNYSTDEEVMGAGILKLIVTKNKGNASSSE